MTGTLLFDLLLVSALEVPDAEAIIEDEVEEVLEIVLLGVVEVVVVVIGVDEEVVETTVEDAIVELATIEEGGAKVDKVVVTEATGGTETATVVVVVAETRTVVEVTGGTTTGDLVVTVEGSGISGVAAAI